MLVVYLSEIAALPFGAEPLHALNIVDAGLRLVHDAVGDIRCKDTRIPQAFFLAEVFIKKHCRGVALLAGGAARAPDTQLVVFGVSYSPGEYYLFKVGVMLRLAHKEGVVCCEFVEYRCDFRTGGICHNSVEILVVAGEAALAQHVAEPSLYQHAFGRKVDAEVVVHIVNKTVEFAVRDLHRSHPSSSSSLATSRMSLTSSPERIMY